MSALLDSLEALGTIAVDSRLDLPPRAARSIAVNDCVGLTPSIRQVVSLLVPNGLLWFHQAEAIKAIAAEENVVVATATASGKSLIFQSAVISALLDGPSTHFVFYPQKALAADQLGRWQEALKRVGLDPALVRQVNGDIPSHEREAALADCRILLVTPDVIHAWFMRQLASPAAKAFLSDLRFVVLDEAHALEGAFGTSTAFLLRRLLRACSIAEAPKRAQFIAATATICHPQEHLQALTGQTFALVADEENGAPKAQVSLAHIAGPGHGTAAEAQLAAILNEVIPRIGENAFIAFADSRQGVERIARRIQREDVLPYRSGYEAADRRRIENALRDGKLKGVVATSALELGIDIPQFVLGINLGLPQSRKALRQRIGRIGRSQPGAFMLMDEPSTFAKLGTTFEDYVTGAVEASPLYLDNEFIQYAQARCLIAEAESTDVAEQVDNCAWPSTFATMVRNAAPGGNRPSELDCLALSEGNAPHLNFPLRQICDQTLALKLQGFADPIGTISLPQAIREAYPGATYFHLQRAHKVTGWRVNSYERTILLRPAKAAQQTHPIIRNCVNASYAAEEVIAGRLLKSETGAVAEVQLQVTESVEGFRTERGSVGYAYLRQTNPRMRRQSREFATTGLIIQIAEPWFTGPGKDRRELRLTLANALREIMCRDNSVATGDIEVAASHVLVRSQVGSAKVDDAIAIYDNLHGGLRLTAPLFDQLQHLAERLCQAADVAGEEALVDFHTATRFAGWVRNLQAATPQATGPIEVPAGEHLIFAPGSFVSFRKNGQTFERRLIAPEFFTFPAGKHLFYRYECESEGSAWVAHDAVEPSGLDWSRVLWNPTTNEMRPCQ